MPYHVSAAAAAAARAAGQPNRTGQPYFPKGKKIQPAATQPFSFSLSFFSLNPHIFGYPKNHSTSPPPFPWNGRGRFRCFFFIWTGPLQAKGINFPSTLYPPRPRTRTRNLHQFEIPSRSPCLPACPFVFRFDSGRPTATCFAPSRVIIQVKNKQQNRPLVTLI